MQIDEIPERTVDFSYCCVFESNMWKAAEQSLILAATLRDSRLIEQAQLPQRDRATFVVETKLNATANYILRRFTANKGCYNNNHGGKKQVA